MHPLLPSHRCSLRRLGPAVSIVLLSYGISGCTGDGCNDVPAVQVGLPAMVTRVSQTNPVQLEGSLTQGVIDLEIWDSVRRFLLTDVASSGGGAVWALNDTKPADDAVLAWVVIWLGSSLQVGDVVQVNAVPGQTLAGAWGTAPAGSKEFQLTATNFIVTSGSGTIQILGIAPLRLRVDLLAENETGDQMQVQGDMSASSGTQQLCN